MTKLNLGCRWDQKEKWINLDVSKEVKPDIVTDLNEGIPFKDNTFDEILASHVIEHLRDFISIMEEIWRVGKPDCIVTIKVPYYNSTSAFRVGHNLFFHERSMNCFLGKTRDKHSYVRFRCERVWFEPTKFGKLIPKFIRLKVSHFIGSITNSINWELRPIKQ